MQDFLTKCGLAAHLALTAVAPLFLFPFCGGSDVAGVLFALSVFAAFWILLSPSRLRGEQPYEARSRVLSSILHDPLFWVLVLILVYSVVTWLNTGIALAYNAEEAVWYRASAAMDSLPASVKGEGAVFAAGAFALLVVVTGTRQALGRAARATFLYYVTVFGGIAAIFDLICLFSNVEGALKAVHCGWTVSSYAGTGFGVILLSGLASLEIAFEEKERGRIFFNGFMVGANVAGLLFFLPLEMSLVFLAVGVIFILFSCSRLVYVTAANDAFKYLSILGLAALIPILAVIWLMPDELLVARSALFSRGTYLPENWLEIRGTLDRIAHTAWEGAPWLGTGIGSFSLDLRFGAEPMDWAIIPAGQATTLNGWWQILAEAGIVGLLLTLIVPAFLLFTWFHRLFAFAKGRKVVVLSATLGIAALALVCLEAFGTVSICRPEVMILVCSLLAVAGKAFPVLPREKAAKDEK